MADGGDSTTEGDAVPTVDWRALRELVADDPDERARRRRGVSLGAALVAWLASFALAWITWDQVAARDVVADQLPWLASGGLTAILLAILGAACLVVAFLPADRVPER